MDHVVDATASGCGGELIGDMAPNVLLSAPCRQMLAHVGERFQRHNGRNFQGPR